MVARTKNIKQFKKKEKETLDSEIRNIIQSPSVGSEKKGDLRRIFVHKFTLYLLSSRMVGEDIEFIMIGPHENYYRDLKLYLKKR